MGDPSKKNKDKQASEAAKLMMNLARVFLKTDASITHGNSGGPVVDAEGLSVLTAWSAGKFSGDRVAKSLRATHATERVSHRTAIIPGYVSVISGELEDALGDGWRVLVGPQEASDIGAFFRDVWGTGGS